MTDKPPFPGAQVVLAFIVGLIVGIALMRQPYVAPDRVWRDGSDICVKVKGDTYTYSRTGGVLSSP